MYESDQVLSGTPVLHAETVLRCAAPSSWDWQLDRPTTATLSLGKNEQALSTYLLELLKIRDYGPGDLRERREHHGVIAMGAKLIVDLLCLLTHSPAQSSPPLKADFAHADLKPVDKPRWLEVRDTLLDSAATVFPPHPPGQP